MEKIHTSKIEALLDGAVDAIITISKAGLIETVNPSAERLFGYENDDFIGRNVNFLMPEPWSSQHDDYLARYQRTNEKRIIGFGREVEGKRRDSSTFPMHLSVSEYSFEGETFYTGIIHDLTVRKDAEDALQRVQKMEAIGQLTGGIAHDFNNLLTVITGNLELLEMQVTDENKLDLLKEAQEAANLGADLTGRLLAFARRSALQPVKLDINSMISDLAGLLKRTLGTSVELKTVLANDLWLSRIDQGQVESAVLNLAVNARDAMPGGGSLVIETHNETIDADYAAQEVGLVTGDYVRISVIDSGFGMTEEIRSRVFEPFFTTKEAGKGTGLGLSMVYGFAKQSGGHLTVYSEENIGTTINIYLPRDQAGTSVEHLMNRIPDADLPVGEERILVVEDDLKVRKLSARRLETLGYNIVVAEDGAKAIELLEKDNAFSLVFTDMVMPGGVSGYQLAEHVKVNHPNVKILLTSGYAEDVVHQDKLLAHQIKLLRKPYKQSDLAHSIRQAIDG